MKKTNHKYAVHETAVTAQSLIFIVSRQLVLSFCDEGVTNLHSKEYQVF